MKEITKKVSPTPADKVIISTCAGVDGGWKRIANINISTGDNWRNDTYSGVSFSQVVSDNWHTCFSTNFSTDGTRYQRVCGRARGYQKGELDNFWAHNNLSQTIDGFYADGFSSINHLQHSSSAYLELCWIIMGLFVVTVHVHSVEDLPLPFCGHQLLL